MPIQIVRNDITKMPVDVIVNSANKQLRNGSGVNGAIHKAAGPELLQECSRLGGCNTGEAKLTGAYRLPCRYVIHTVGPVWNGGKFGEPEQLRSCYRACLELAAQHNCTSIAFPLISSGIFGYPKDQAMRIAIDTISDFLFQNDTDPGMMVYLVVFAASAVQISRKFFPNIDEFIDDHYVEAHRDTRLRRTMQLQDMAMREAPPCMGCLPTSAPSSSLDDWLKTIDAGFAETLAELIKQSGKKNSEIYKKANVDKKLFSKIINNPGYHPSKGTALAFAIALELDLDETKDLIGKAGYTLSHSSKFDIIVEYFILQKHYHVLDINIALFDHDQMLLG